MHLSFIGTIKEEILDKVEIAYQLTKFLIENYTEKLCERYKITEQLIEEKLKQDASENENIYEIMLEIGKKRGCIIAGGKIDEEKTARMILDEFKNGIIGKITIENCKRRMNFLTILGGKMDEFIDLTKSEEEVNLLSPLTWAYIGDCVYELYIRTNLVNDTCLKPHKLHIETIKYVKAKAQAEILEKIKDKLTEEEKHKERRGRNTENHHLPKNSNIQEYMYATAFEALIGYLYLTKKFKRLKEILDYTFSID